MLKRDEEARLKKAEDLRLAQSVLLPQGHPAVSPAMPGGLPSSGWGPGRIPMVEVKAVEEAKKPAEIAPPNIAFSKFMNKVGNVMMGPCPYRGGGERGCAIGYLSVERQKAYVQKWAETGLPELPQWLIGEIRAEVEQVLCPSQSVRDALQSQRRAADEQYESSTFSRGERILRGTW